MKVQIIENAQGFALAMPGVLPDDNALADAGADLAYYCPARTTGQHRRAGTGGHAGQEAPPACCGIAAGVMPDQPADAQPAVLSGAKAAPMKVMIVDDDEIFADELADLLSCAGYAVEAFVDSVAALNAVHRVKPAVIILDIKMNKVNGYQAAWYLRKFQETAAIPIIGISGYAGDGDPQQIAAVCGMNAFLKKPLYPLDIIARLEQLTAAPAAGAGPAAPFVPAASRARAANDDRQPAVLTALTKPKSFNKRSSDNYPPRH